jgi:capsid protein
MKSNLIDSLVDYFSPSAGLRRQRARLAQSFLAEHARKYEGASSGRRTDGWKARQVTSVNAEIGPALHLVRERSRDLVRNDPYATRAVAGITANVIGTGIMYDMAGEGGARGSSRTPRRSGATGPRARTATPTASTTFTGFRAWPSGR